MTRRPNPPKRPPNRVCTGCGSAALPLAPCGHVHLTKKRKEVVCTSLICALCKHVQLGSVSSLHVKAQTDRNPA